ncbi:hypothetical protein C8R47DRAFT_1119488 [Mycena vitilis]|nr:hypothetical protein C8R47DRAFT_1119488 [Mycena vitilis]
MWLVFVTAVNTPQKELNRAFLLIQGFEYGYYPGSSEWLLWISNLQNLHPPSEDAEATPIPLPKIPYNDFALASLAEINAFVRANEKRLNDLDVSSVEWLIMDQKGLETSTCLVCQQVYNFGDAVPEYEVEVWEEGEGQTQQFRACRTPYEEAYNMVSSLEMGDTHFTDWVEGAAGVQEDGAWRWTSWRPDKDDSEEPLQHELKRQNAMQELRLGGYVD